MDSIKAVFGGNIKYYRKQRGLSQEELAEDLGISPKHLSTIETGAVFVSAGLLEKLSKRLEVSAAALFYTAGEKSGDDSVLAAVDRITDTELARAAESIKFILRRSVS